MILTYDTISNLYVAVMKQGINDIKSTNNELMQQIILDELENCIFSGYFDIKLITSRIRKEVLKDVK